MAKGFLPDQAQNSLTYIWKVHSKPFPSIDFHFQTSGAAQSKITDAELATFSENAFKKDSNNQFQHVTVDLQGKVPQTENGDSAPDK